MLYPNPPLVFLRFAFAHAVPYFVLLRQVHRQCPSKLLFDVTFPLHWLQSGPSLNIHEMLQVFSLTIFALNDNLMLAILILRLNSELLTLGLYFIFDMVFLKVLHTVSFIKWRFFTN